MGFFKRLLDYYAKEKYAGVIFSGGEPTLYSELAELIHYAVEKELQTRIITNGQMTADINYLRSLKEAGLNHIGVSVYSDDAKIQAFLTQNKNSLKNIIRSLDNINRLGGFTTDIITVINKYNAGHLSRIVRWIITSYPFVRHFVWNNLDPAMNRASWHLDTIPSLNDFELELFYAMSALRMSHRTFRVERVPLCYMADFADSSTETRKIVKNEERMVYFLDEKNLVRQKKWQYQKAAACQICSCRGICAGLYQMDGYYDSKELYPLFIDKDEIIKRVIS